MRLGKTHSVKVRINPKNQSVAGGHSETLNGRGEKIRPKQLGIFRGSVNPPIATILKRWRGEESPSVHGGEDVNLSTFIDKKLAIALGHFNPNRTPATSEQRSEGAFLFSISRSMIGNSQERDLY
jgi:hypothetical protein